MATSEKIIDRLRRMKEAVDQHGQTGAAFSTEAEAQNFAATLQRLLMEHDLSMTDIEYSAKDETIEKRVANFREHGVKDRPRRVIWIEELTGTIAKSFNCRRWIMPGSIRPVLIGRKQDVDIAEYMCAALVRSADQMSEHEAKRFKRQMKRTCAVCRHNLEWHERRGSAKQEPRYEGGEAWWKYDFQSAGHVAGIWDFGDSGPHAFEPATEEARGFRVSFLNAFIKRLRERLDEQREATKREAASSGTALVRIDNALVRVDSWIGALKAEREKSGVKVRSAHCLSENRHYNDAGTKRGREVANNVTLTANAIRQNERPRQQLGGKR